MLKDALQQLINDSDKVDCRVGALMASVDKETANLLEQVLKSNVSGMQLVKLLQSEGIKISRETLRNKRNECFKAQVRPSTCCMAQGGSSKAAK